MNPLVMALMAAARQRQSQGPLVYESVITPADFHIATKDGEAMFFHDSIDFSTYAGTDAGNTPYKFVLTDGSGNRAEAWGGAVGGGETLGASIATGTLTSGRLYKITATEADHFGTGLVIGDYFTSDGTESCDANNTVEPLTDVAATGLHLMSSMDGTTRDMSLVESGFDPNNVTSVKIYRDANYLYDDTVSDLRISAVDGTAFLDNLPAAALGYVNGRNWVTITDSAGKKLEGVLKAKGTGETLGSELIDASDDRDFTTFANINWAGYSGGSVSDGGGKLQVTMDSSGSCGTVLNKTNINSGTAYAGLVKIQADIWQGTTVLNGFQISAAVDWENFDISGTQTTYQKYMSMDSTVGLGIYFLMLTSDNGTFFMDNVSFKQVLTPSTSGCTIVDGELSTTQNFASVESGFAFNESSHSVTITREREV